jgi:hypothetical protein
LILHGPRPHTLVIAPTASAEVALARLHQRLQAPVMHWWPTGGTDLPRPTSGTLVIWEVDALDRTQQHQLLAWMEIGTGKAQLISISERPVYPLVERAEFLDLLYYRLNTVCTAITR